MCEDTLKRFGNIEEIVTPALFLASQNHLM